MKSATEALLRDYVIGITSFPTLEPSSYALNPRLHSMGKMERIAGSISTLGFNVPILVDANTTPIAGHGRLRATIHLGM